MGIHIYLWEGGKEGEFLSERIFGQVKAWVWCLSLLEIKHELSKT